MNEYLKPVFEQILPTLINAGIKYWIYGGVANAAMVGHCYRSNPDVDMFVLGEDFEKVENVLQNMCKENNWKICKVFVNNRPKIEISILKNNKKWIERFSVISAHKKENHVELKFKNGSGQYPLNILDQVEILIDGYKFFTVGNDFLKKLFIEYLDSKKKYPSKRIADARYILSKKEFKKYFSDKPYEKS